MPAAGAVKPRARTGYAVPSGARYSSLRWVRQIAAIRAPTLILAWTGDAIHPESTAEALGSLLPQADLSVATTAEDLTGWSGRVATFVRDLG